MQALTFMFVYGMTITELIAVLTRKDISIYRAFDVLFFIAGILVILHLHGVIQ